MILCQEEYDKAYSSIVERNNAALVEILQNSSAIRADSVFFRVPPKSNIFGDRPFPFLNIAILFNNFDALEILLDFGADVDCYDGYHNTPLHCAAVVGDVRTIARLLHDELCHPTPTNIDKRLPLHLASIHNHFGAVQYLIEHFSFLLDSKDSFSRTALSYAVENGNMAIIDYLITKEKADVTTIDSLGNTLLHISIEHHKNDALKFLISTGAFKHLNHINVHGQTPLHMAAMNGNFEAFSLLIEHQADPRILDSKHRSVLLLAIESSSFDIFKYIIDNQLVYPAELDSLGVSAIHYAAKNKDINFMKELSKIDSLAPYINDTTGGFAPIHIAAKLKHYAVLQFLLTVESIDSSAEDTYGQTLLHMAARTTNYDFLRYALTIPDLNVFTTDKKGVCFFIFWFF